MLILRSFAQIRPQRDRWRHSTAEYDLGGPEAAAGQLWTGLSGHGAHGPLNRDGQAGVPFCPRARIGRTSRLTNGMPLRVYSGQRRRGGRDPDPECLLHYLVPQQPVGDGRSIHSGRLVLHRRRRQARRSRQLVHHGPAEGADQGQGVRSESRSLFRHEERSLMPPRFTLQFPSRARRTGGFAVRFATRPRCRRHFSLPRRPRDRVPAGIRRPLRQGNSPGRTQGGGVCAHPANTHRGQARPLQVVRTYSLICHAQSLSEDAVAYRLDFAHAGSAATL